MYILITQDIILLFSASLVSAGIQQQVVVVPEQQVAHGYEAKVAYGGEYDHNIQIDASAGKGSTGAELSSLAHSSAIQAKNAVRSQQTAGSQAAFGVKSSLATAAIGVRLSLRMYNSINLLCVHLGCPNCASSSCRKTSHHPKPQATSCGRTTKTSR